MWLGGTKISPRFGAGGVLRELVGGKWAVEVEPEHAPGRLGPPDVTVWEQGEAGRSGIGLVWWVGARLPVWRRVPGRASAQDIYVKVTRKNGHHVDV